MKIQQKEEGDCKLKVLKNLKLLILNMWSLFIKTYYKASNHLKLVDIFLFFRIFIFYILFKDEM